VDSVKFTRMKDGDREDYVFLEHLEKDYCAGTADRLLDAMQSLDKSLSGYQVTRLGHSLQSATRAWRDGADIDWVVGALLHDIGDIYAPMNHDEYAAAIVRPFLREQVAWCVQTHGDFQLVYFARHVGANPDKRDAYRGHAYFDDCAAFCERWDQSSFDPAYPGLPLDFFAGMVREVFDRAPYDPAVIRPGVRVALTDSETARQRGG